MRFYDAVLWLRAPEGTSAEDVAAAVPLSRVTRLSRARPVGSLDPAAVMVDRVLWRANGKSACDATERYLARVLNAAGHHSILVTERQAFPLKRQHGLSWATVDPTYVEHPLRVLGTPITG